MCPKCGNVDAVLQAVTSEHFECREELGGCGAEFSKPIGATQLEPESINTAILSMRNAIQAFEESDLPMSPDSLLSIRNEAGQLLDILKREIGRIASLLADSKL
jgi:hypothetical protein